MIPSLTAESVAAFQEICQAELIRIEEMDRIEDAGWPADPRATQALEALSQANEAAATAFFGADGLQYAQQRLFEACPTGEDLDEYWAIAQDESQSRHVLALTLADLHVDAYARAAAIDHLFDRAAFIQQAKTDPDGVVRAVLAHSALSDHPPEQLRQAIESVTREWVREVDVESLSALAAASHTAYSEHTVEPGTGSGREPRTSPETGATFPTSPRQAPADPLLIVAQTQLAHLRHLEHLDRTTTALVDGHARADSGTRDPVLHLEIDNATQDLDTFLGQHAARLGQVPWVRDWLAEAWEAELFWRDGRLTEDEDWKHLAVALTVAEHQTDSDPDAFTRIYETLFAQPLGANPVQDLLERLSQHYPPVQQSLPAAAEPVSDGHRSPSPSTGSRTDVPTPIHHPPPAPPPPPSSRPPRP